MSTEQHKMYFSYLIHYLTKILTLWRISLCWKLQALVVLQVMCGGHVCCVSSVGLAHLCRHHQTVQPLAVCMLHFHRERDSGSQQEMTQLLGSLSPAVALAQVVILAGASNSYSPVTHSHWPTVKLDWHFIILLVVQTPKLCQISNGKHSTKRYVFLGEKLNLRSQTAKIIAGKREHTNGLLITLRTKREVPLHILLEIYVSLSSVFLQPSTAILFIWVLAVTTTWKLSHMMNTLGWFTYCRGETQGNTHSPKSEKPQVPSSLSFTKISLCLQDSKLPAS